MSTSKKIARWTGTTRSHFFEVTFYEDAEQGLFIAKFEVRPLKPTPSRRDPGKSPKRVETPDSDRLRDESLDVLMARSRAHLKARYGELVDLQNRN